MSHTTRESMQFLITYSFVIDQEAQQLSLHLKKKNFSSYIINILMIDIHKMICSLKKNKPQADMLHNRQITLSTKWE